MGPGSGAYDKGNIYNDWSKQLPKNHGKFKHARRYMISDEIIKKHEKKEKSSPGPNAYNKDQW